MQTFLPYPSFYRSFRVLDDKYRLGNQVYRETYTFFKGGWPHHPAFVQWKGYERALAIYGLVGAYEMTRRFKEDGTPKYKTDVCNRWIEYYKNLVETLPDTGLPPWLGNKKLHKRHRERLLEKWPKHYKQFFKKDKPSTKDYIWGHMINDGAKL